METTSSTYAFFFPVCQVSGRRQCNKPFQYINAVQEKHGRISYASASNNNNNNISLTQHKERGVHENLKRVKFVQGNWKVTKLIPDVFLNQNTWGALLFDQSVLQICVKEILMNQINSYLFVILQCISREFQKPNRRISILIT